MQRDILDLEEVQFSEAIIKANIHAIRYVIRPIGRLELATALEKIAAEERRLAVTERHTQSSIDPT